MNEKVAATIDLGKIKNIYDRILKACQYPNEDAGINAVVPLTTIEDFNYNKVALPIYPDKNKRTYDYRYNAITKENEKIVVLDSIPSSANRMEKALLNGFKKGMKMPNVLVNVKALGEDGVPKQFSVLEMAHRIFDANIRITKDKDNKYFYDTELGKAVYSANEIIALKAVLKCNPAALTFGGWCSNSGRTRGLKFSRIVLSEIIAGFQEEFKSYTNKQDPFGITSGTKIVLNTGTYGKPIEIANKNTKVKKDSGKTLAAPSDAGFGPMPCENPVKNVSVSWIKEKFSITLHGLFEYATDNEDADPFIRVYLAAIALYAHALRATSYVLRSGCRLKRLEKEIVYVFSNFDNKDNFTLNENEARAFYDMALEPVRKYLELEPYVFNAAPELETLISNSLMAKKTKKTKETEETEEAEEN